MGGNRISSVIENLVKGYIENHEAEKKPIPKNVKQALGQLAEIHPFYLDYPDLHHISSKVHSRSVIMAAMKNKEVYNFLKGNKKEFYKCVGIDPEKKTIDIDKFCDLFSECGKQYELTKRGTRYNPPRWMIEMDGGCIFHVSHLDGRIAEALKLQKKKFGDHVLSEWQDVNFEEIPDMLKTTWRLLRESPMRYTWHTYEGDTIYETDWSSEGFELFDMLEELMLSSTIIKGRSVE